MLEDIGARYSDAVSDDIAKRYDASLARMTSDGATIAELPLAEQRRWIDAMPNIALRWAEATDRRGIPATEVLRAYMSAVRAHGVQPLRDWDRPN
jgi:hypothetical protein